MCGHRRLARLGFGLRRDGHPARGLLRLESALRRPQVHRRVRCRTLYEKSDPYFLPGPGGVLDLTGCTFTEHADGTVEVRGSSTYIAPTWSSIEGSAPVGYRTLSIAGTRDPIMIASIDSILEAVKARVSHILGDEAKAHVFFPHLRQERRDGRPRAAQADYGTRTEVLKR